MPDHLDQYFRLARKAFSGLFVQPMKNLDGDIFSRPSDRPVHLRETASPQTRENPVFADNGPRRQLAVIFNGIVFAI